MIIMVASATASSRSSSMTPPTSRMVPKESIGEN
jgi:hypothetical protein